MGNMVDDVADTIEEALELELPGAWYAVSRGTRGRRESVGLPLAIWATGGRSFETGADGRIAASPETVIVDLYGEVGTYRALRETARNLIVLLFVSGRCASAATLDTSLADRQDAPAGLPPDAITLSLSADIA